jgi:peptidoglycan/xylan/chitin deacetylase (PgdA/CDA1 family)
MGAPIRSWLWRAAILSLFAAGLFVLFAAQGAVTVKLAAVALVSFAAVLAAYRWLPAFDPRGRVRWRLDARGPKHCAITFDDGPSASTTQVLDILATEAVRATFFVLGTHAERHPQIVRRMQAEGHSVAIHGMTHTKLGSAAEPAVEQQVGAAAAMLLRIGVTPAPLYRTPHGCKSRGVFSVARRRGLTLWAWSRGIWDTDRPDPDVLVSRATRFARSGMVLLLHDGRGDERDPDIQSMVVALPRILGELKRRGFEFVRLADA